ncbi:Protein RESPONSE TO ABA AND SALT 1 [Hirschfeldia incana]|nr:Protein RESPONSE TO ABA AND SALT 1 [Hirschfeldia incana]
MPITSSSQSFSSFVNGWLIRHRYFVEQLTCASSYEETNRIALEEQQQSLVTQFLSHCLQYYQEKSSAVSLAGDNVFTFFCPPWFSPYARLILWVGDFKPSLVFKLTDSSVGDLSRHQRDRISSLRSETRRKERDVMRDYALVQQSVADPPVMLAARRVGARGMVDGDESDLEEAMEVLKRGMARAMNKADELRCSTVGKVVEILTPSQAVKVLRTIGELHLRLRELVGLERDHE